MPQNSTGQSGEDAAADYLCARGYTIVGRNFRTRCGEIDIIASDGYYIVFAEVKTRRRGSMLLPREAVDAKKQRKIIDAAKLYLSGHNIGELQPRFDVIEVTTRTGAAFSAEEINQIENAFTL